MKLKLLIKIYKLIKKGGLGSEFSELLEKLEKNKI